MSIMSDQQKSHTQKLTFHQQVSVAHTRGTVYSVSVRSIASKMAKLLKSLDAQITECRVTSSDILHQRHFLYISRTTQQYNVFHSPWLMQQSFPYIRAASNVYFSLGQVSLTSSHNNRKASKGFQRFTFFFELVYTSSIYDPWQESFSLVPALLWSLYQHEHHARISALNHARSP